MAPAMNIEHAGAPGRAGRPADAGGAAASVFVEPGRGVSGLRLDRARGAWPSRTSIVEPRRTRACSRPRSAYALARRWTRALRGRKILVTAGPTYEDIDPVRYVGNRSSGRMGFALAAEAAGAAPTSRSLPVPRLARLPEPSAHLVRGSSAAEMHAGGRCSVAAGMDLVVMAAAVADYTPASCSGRAKMRQGGCAA